MRKSLLVILSLLLTTTASGCNLKMPDGLATVTVESLRFGNPSIPSEAGKVFYETTVLDADPPLPAQEVEFFTPYVRGWGMTHQSFGDWEISTVGLYPGMVVALTYYVLPDGERAVVDYNLLLPEDLLAPPKNAREEAALLSAISGEVAKSPTSWSLLAIRPQGNTARILIDCDKADRTAEQVWTAWALIKKGAKTEPYDSLKANWRENYR